MGKGCGLAAPARISVCDRSDGGASDDAHMIISSQRFHSGLTAGADRAMSPEAAGPRDQRPIPSDVFVMFFRAYDGPARTQHRFASDRMSGALQASIGLRPGRSSRLLTPGRYPLEGRLQTLTLAAVAIGLVIVEPFPKGAVLVSLTPTHGVDVGDLPAVALLLVAACLAI